MTTWFFHSCILLVGNSSWSSTVSSNCGIGILFRTSALKSGVFRRSERLAWYGLISSGLFDLRCNAEDLLPVPDRAVSGDLNAGSELVIAGNVLDLLKDGSPSFQSPWTSSCAVYGKYRHV